MPATQPTSETPRTDEAVNCGNNRLYLDSAQASAFHVENLCRRLERDNATLRALVVKGLGVVEDFMPNIGRCALQDYQSMNEFLVEAGKVKRAALAGPA